jgi:eukaryotic-like serine/threonine-protein kinase
MIGRVFMGRYEAIRLLGEGGMGRVYLARQLDLGRQVVVKVMHDHIAADETFRARFERETKLMAGFQHPYAVTLYDATLDDPSGQCIIMEYVRGVNLDALLSRNGRFTPARVGRIVGQLCEVLQAAHEQGIVHRDLKPANLMVMDADTPREKIKVMDFGLAKKPVDSAEWRKVTDTNVDFAVGTPGYISPEQVRGEEMDHRGDLYSVGVLIYELLTGRLPFQGPSSMDMLLAHATEAPPTFAELGLEGWAPADIEELVMNCLAKDPADRPQHAREIAERYDLALTREMEAHESGQYQSAPPPPAAASGGAMTPVARPAVEVDPNALVFQMEAWMPEKIALMKMRGFVNDLGGEVLESVPGLMRFRLGGVAGRRKDKQKASTPSPFAWFGFGRRHSNIINMEMRLVQTDPARENSLLITVLFLPESSAQALDTTWRAKCTQMYCEVRDYLMARAVGE